MSAEEDELREFLSQYRKTSSTPRVGMRKWGALDVSVWINKDGKRWRKSFGHLTHILGGSAGPSCSFLKRVARNYTKGQESFVQRYGCV
jgi:hypothetical protein